MIAVFAACGIVSLGQMEVTNVATLLEGKFWTDAIAFVQEKNGPQTFGFWQIVVFAWHCNGAMHLGMTDLSIFRIARSKASGWAPSIGMFLGHYMAWIAAALLLAALIKIQPELALGSDGKVTANPGLLAFESLGWAGIICVVIAGWTTAKPTILPSRVSVSGHSAKEFADGDDTCRRSGGDHRGSLSKSIRTVAWVRWNLWHGTWPDGRRGLR